MPKGRGSIDSFRLRGSRRCRRMGDTATTSRCARRWCTLLTPQRSTLRGRRPRRCGPGCAWKSALDAGWHGFPESSTVKRSRASDCVSPTSPSAAAAPHGRGRWWRERRPFFRRWYTTGQGELVHPYGHTISPSPLGGRSLHSDPCGKAVESAKKPTAEKQQTTNGP